MNLPYTKTNWDESTAITAVRLNNQEDGIGDVKAYVDAQVDIANQNVLDAKTPIATAISSKLVDANPSDTFSQLATKIGQIGFWGDGSDGALNTSGNVTFSARDFSHGFSPDLIVKQYENVIINSGHTVTVDNPCRGLVIYSQDNITINGIIDMTKKASYKGCGYFTLPIGNIVKDIDFTGGAGGNGGRGGGNATSLGGNGGLGRINLGGFAGGGAGGSIDNNLGSVGGSISSKEVGFLYKFPGVTVSTAPSTPNSWPPSTSEGALSGNGGYGRVQLGASSSTFARSGGKAYGGGGGGVGANYTQGSTSGTDDGGDGEEAGGLIILIARGDITINGQVVSNGGDGGDGSNAITTTTVSGLGAGGGGGGAGGGVIALFYGGTYTNNGTIQVNGGLGGIAGTSPLSQINDALNGQSGGVGTIYTEQL